MYLLLLKKRSRIWNLELNKTSGETICLKRLPGGSRKRQRAPSSDEAPIPSLMAYHWWNVLNGACTQTIHGFCSKITPWPISHVGYHHASGWFLFELLWCVHLHTLSYPWLQFQGCYSFGRSFALVTAVGLLQEAAKATQSSNLGCSEGLMFPTFHDVPHQEMTQLLGTCYEHCNRNVLSLIISLHWQRQQLSYLGLAPQMPCRTWSLVMRRASL
jgi:hypothetical protein